ncbi:S-adenosyl-L-methionine-dependent methyltransferase-15 [Coleophoma cylindrospora]|uniref:S-adenosyl-L-methionine-dependent methyltransferase-15 n=1 Tax=Coleophoma cylindrospora TaxID=1849047 RepID=A0A3D8QL46_9HELO|nr:S-adenosyl-L-methionine-dependent methyltransferase-15 [Coleophoma cylindrospora]
MATASPAADAIIAPEDDDWAEDDSAIGYSTLEGSTSSLASSILKYRHENGRTYHSYKEGKYMLPNDESEMDRLDLLHHLCGLTFDNKLFLCPIDTKKVHRVLDSGTGTGIWAIDFGDENPQAQVIGVDLSPIQPQFVPPNVAFQVDDIEEPWTFSYKFDFIYSRRMHGSIKSWPRFFGQAFANLNPGGWIECCDGILPMRTDDNSFPENSALKRWGDLMVDAMSESKFGRPLDSALHYESQLAAAGFKNIVVLDYKWPTNRWPKDKKLKEFGMWNNSNLVGGIAGLSTAACTRLCGMSLEETEAFMDDCRKELNDTKIHAYWPL